MAPFSLMSVGVNLLVKSLGLFSTASVVRCSCVAPVLKRFSTTTGGPPKRPLTAYMTYVKEMHPTISRQNPGVKNVDIVRKLAQQWKMLAPEQKQPFQDASLTSKEQYKLAVEKYKAQLTPAQTAALAIEKQQKVAKRNAIRRKKELNSLGKPKRPRSVFNIFMSEHFEEAKGNNIQVKMDLHAVYTVYTVCKNNIKMIQRRLGRMCCGQMRPKLSSLALTRLAVFGGREMLTIAMFPSKDVNLTCALNWNIA
uniref:Transcription factor A, mitochondrial n=1 Tax=Sinocyclocheilus grahami TaxID=75366 RepID=A0A672K5N9_SINGR